MSEQEKCDNCGGELVPHCLDCQDSEDLTARWTLAEADAAFDRLTAQVAALTEQRDALLAALKLWVKDYEAGPGPFFDGYEQSLSAIAQGEAKA